MTEMHDLTRVAPIASHIVSCPDRGSMGFHPTIESGAAFCRCYEQMTGETITAGEARALLGSWDVDAAPHNCAGAA